MKLNEKKYERQLIGYNKFFRSGELGLSYKNRCGCLNYMTGVGKTFTAILIIKGYFQNNPQTNIVILVPSHLVIQWNNKLKEHLTASQRKYIQIYTPDTVLSNDIILNPQVLIVDELHEFYSEKRMKLLDKTYIRYVDILGLTATYEDIHDRHLDVKNICPIIDKISEKEALKEGYISEYIEYNLGIDFSKEEKEAHDSYSDDIRKGLSKFDNNLELAFKCLTGGKYKGKTYTSTQMCTGWAVYKGWTQNASIEVQNLWNPKTIFMYSVHLSKAIKARKELIYNNTGKLATTVAIMKKFANTKSVIFSQSIEFADTLYGIINQMQPDNAVIYHSRVKTQFFPSPKTGKPIKHGKVRLKRRAIDRIEKGLSNHLITGSGLDSGLDIPDLRIGITTSGTQNPRQYKQRKGRSVRVDHNNTEAVSIIINLYMKQSQDVKWLSKRQSLSKNIINWIDSVEEISYKQKTKKEGIDINKI